MRRCSLQLWKQSLHWRLSRKHEETDDDLMEELHMKPLDDVKDKKFESDLRRCIRLMRRLMICTTPRNVMKKILKDEYFNMDDNKWDEMIKEAMEQDGIKEKVEQRFNALGDMCERVDVEPEEAYNRSSNLRMRWSWNREKMEAEGPLQFDKAMVPDNKKDLDDPLVEGSMLRQVFILEDEAKINFLDKRHDRMESRPCSNSCSSSLSKEHYSDCYYKAVEFTCSACLFWFVVLFALFGAASSYHARSVGKLQNMDSDSLPEHRANELQCRRSAPS
ncbi:hypothetical protein GH714_024568 [Hevea brasiliensis]|uniref:Uncharacterized protein n=1 Tax=Hevea brasiliensis TaxID=3981 RepID=A0A6A6LB41_HEVBR|nr:hypothetical protein GH714_024568 [Hevea brasiliensis]